MDYNPTMSISLSQASGEAQYVNDIPTFQQELFGAFVITDQAAATLESMDATEALVCSSLKYHILLLQRNV